MTIEEEFEKYFGCKPGYTCYENWWKQDAKIKRRRKKKNKGGSKEQTYERGANNTTVEREEVILRAAIYCVRAMMFKDNNVGANIHFNKHEDGIDASVDLVNVLSYLSEKLYDLKHDL